MYGDNSVGKRTRSKEKQYEEALERSRKHNKNKRKREAENSKPKYAHHPINYKKFDIVILPESEDDGKDKDFRRNQFRKISAARGETSKYEDRNKLQGKVKGNDKRASHRHIDEYVISSDDSDDYDQTNSKDAESVASVAVPNFVAVPSAKDVKEVKKRSKENPYLRVGSRNWKGKKKSDKDIQEHGEDSSSDTINLLDEVKDMAKGKDLQRDFAKASRNLCRTSISKVGNKVLETCHEAEITSKQPNCSHEAVDVLSSSDDGDSIAESSEDEESVPSSTDSDSEKQSDTSEDVSSSPEDPEDEDFEISDSESSKSSESNSSSDDEENQKSSQELNFSCPPMVETGRKSPERQQLDSSSDDENQSSPPMAETGRKCVERQWSSKVVESGSSTSSHEISVSKEEEKDKKENEEINQLPKASRRPLGTREDDTFNILANSILHQGDVLEKMSFEQQEEITVARTGLPLKFSFDDEIPEPPERSDLDKEVDKLFSEMCFALECEAIDSNSHSEEYADGASTIEDVCEAIYSNSQANIYQEFGEGAQTNKNGCDHIYVVDEEIGLICRYCRHIKTEIRYILPSFATRTKRFAREGSSKKEKGAMFDSFGLESSSDCNKNSSLETDGTVWETLHGVKHTLYQHQRDGFEFLWRNIGGTINLSQLSSTSSEIGGCIISHAPGTGKTRLASEFIKSYLKLFPGSRPVIIAPANMLNTWEEQIEKWNVGFPFHNLNREEPSGKEDKIALELISRSNKHKTDDVRMAKLYSWDREDSILGVSYSLLEKLGGMKPLKSKKRGKKQKTKATNEELKEDDNPWRDILLKKPGLVILDEGHTPRNKQSNIWNTLVKLHTRKIIILSGTPFQNSVDELLNSVSLIRPQVGEFLRKEKKFTDLMTSLKSSRHQSQGEVIEKFKAAIEPFVHVHKGSILQQTLPGLREYVIILKPHELQKSLLKEIETNNFESEHKVALISVHPQLHQIYSSKKDKNPGLCEGKADYKSLLPNEGVKTRFVLEIVRLSLRLDEKVLIFSQYREPLYLIRDQMEKKFSWREGQEIFLVEGGMAQSKRQNVIRSFNDPKSEVKVLLASTKCCSEGISLVGASRVVLLDVVWNPSVALQAISRSFRIGQEKMVYAYNLMISGTTEADKYRRQAQKERFSELVFTSTNKEVEEQRKPMISASDDRILDSMVDHSSMKDIFDSVIGQPKDSSFFKLFG